MRREFWLPGVKLATFDHVLRTMWGSMRVETVWVDGIPHSKTHPEMEWAELEVMTSAPVGNVYVIRNPERTLLTITAFQASDDALTVEIAEGAAKQDFHLSRSADWLNELFPALPATKERTRPLAVYLLLAGNEPGAAAPAIDSAQQATTPTAQLEDAKPRRRGRRRLLCNEWARAEYAKGRTIDELLTEYAERYKNETGNDLVDPRESLKQALK